MNRKALHGWFAECSPIRRTAEAILRAAGRRHLAHLDRQSPFRCQRRILLGLLNQARNTQFGREHDFRRIRSVEDFRRLVPLRSHADFWREYWQPVYPQLAGTTWPGEKNKDAIAALMSCHRAALRTAFALALSLQPRKSLLAGAVLVPSEEGPANVWERGNSIERLPMLARPYAEMDERARAERCAHRPVSCLIGSIESLLPLLQHIKQIRGQRDLSDIWPELSVILFSRRSPSSAASQLREEAEGVPLLEMAGRGEGPIAVQDPHSGLFRLLFDHGVYFEFVPPERIGDLRCPRLGIDEIEVGVPYELVVTSPAGLWACRVGRTVCLESRNPLLLRFVEPIAPKRRQRHTDLILPTPAEAERRPQSDDIPAAPPRSFFHSPWSTLADRG